MASRINGFTVGYTIAGAVVLWSGIKGATISDTFRSVLANKKPTPTEQITGTSSSSMMSTSSAVAAAKANENIPASSGGSLSDATVRGYWILAGGPASEAKTASAIAMAESSRRPGAIQQGQPYATTGWGLWQITPGNSEPQIGVDKALLHPLTNARAAIAKYRAAGNSFSPWTTYEDGAYQQYM